MDPLEQAAMAMARVQYDETCNGTKPDDETWVLVWQNVYTSSVRSRYLAMAMAALKVFSKHPALVEEASQAR